MTENTNEYVYCIHKSKDKEHTCDVQFFRENTCSPRKLGYYTNCKCFEKKRQYKKKSTPLKKQIHTFLLFYKSYKINNNEFILSIMDYKYDILRRLHKTEKQKRKRKSKFTKKMSSKFKRIIKGQQKIGYFFNGTTWTGDWC